jgi:hypothetical protein
MSLQAQLQLLELLGRHLDADLLVRQALDLDLVEPVVEQLGLEAARQTAHLARVVEAGDHQPRHLLVAGQQRHLGLLGVLREVAELVDEAAHLVQRQQRVGPSSNSMVMAEMPWLEVEVILSRLSTVRSRCSSGLVMPSSTSSALAPLQTTRT